jgi:hypothetical protein
MFDGWENALVASGIKPSLIRARRPKTAKSRSAHLPMQNEDLLDDLGKRQYGALIGFAAQDPEEICSQRSEVDLLFQTIDSLAEDDRDLAQRIIQLILCNSQIDTLEDAVSEYAKHDEALADRAFRLFATIKLSALR